MEYEYLEKLGSRKIGFLAQQLRKIIPNAVAHDPQTDRFIVDYQAIVPYTVSAVHGLSAEHQSLSKRVATLEATFAQLTAAAAKSRTSREEARDAFSCGDYDKALGLYALALEKETDAVQVSLLHSSRAACLYKLTKYRHCLREARSAIAKDAHNFKGLVWRAAAIARLQGTHTLAGVALACAAYAVARDKGKHQELANLPVWRELFSAVSEVRMRCAYMSLTLDQ